MLGKILNLEMSASTSNLSGLYSGRPVACLVPYRDWLGLKIAKCSHLQTVQCSYLNKAKQLFGCDQIDNRNSTKRSVHCCGHLLVHCCTDMSLAVIDGISKSPSINLIVLTQTARHCKILQIHFLDRVDLRYTSPGTH